MYIDITPLAYVAGTLIGHPAIRAWVLTPLPSPSHPLSVVRPSIYACLDIPSLDTVSDVSGTNSVSFFPRSRTPLIPGTLPSVLDEKDCIRPFSSDGLHRSTYGHTHSTLFTTAEAMPASRALQVIGTTPLPLSSKEHLGIVNGTAFSAGLAALVVRNAETIVILSAVRSLRCLFELGPGSKLLFCRF